MLYKVKREQDKEMMQEIVNEFFIKKLQQQYITYNEIEKILNHHDLSNFINDWKHKMYLKLLEIFSFKIF